MQANGATDTAGAACAGQRPQQWPTGGQGSAQHSLDMKSSQGEALPGLLQTWYGVAARQAMCRLHVTRLTREAFGPGVAAGQAPVSQSGHIWGQRNPKPLPGRLPLCGACRSPRGRANRVHEWPTQSAPMFF